MIRNTKRAARLLATVAAAAFGAITAAPALGQSGEETVASQSESARLNAWFAERFEDAVARSPMTLTTLGRPERNDEWDDVSDAFARSQLETALRNLWEMRARFDYDALDADTQLS